MSSSSNDLGNECLSRKKVDEAIQNYNVAIEFNCYSSIPRFNKRYANIFVRDETEKSDEDLTSRIKDVSLSANTNFVVSTILHVPVNDESSFDSSDEEGDDEFNSQFAKIEKIKGEKNWFPYMTSKPTEKRKSSESNDLAPEKRRRMNEEGDSISTELLNLNPSPSAKPQKRKGILENQNMIYDIPACESDTQSKFVAGFLDKLSENGFEGFDWSEKALIRVSIALNRMQSVSTRKNRSLSLELRSKVDTAQSLISFERFGFLWPCDWYDRDSHKPVDYQKVRKFYKQLKRKNTDLAKQFIELLLQEEDKFEGNTKNIPYQRLREEAKNHQITKNFVQELRTRNSKANIYLSIMDGDVVDFNGIFSAYLRIVQGCYKTPTVMSTGYEFPRDNKYGVAYQKISQLDRMLRVVTTFHLPLGTYYPEPNMCVLIPKDHLTIPESFVEKKRGNALESAVLLTNMQEKRPNATFIFSDDQPLITSIPSRARVWKHPRAKEERKIKFTGEFEAGHLPSENDLKEFDNVSQSTTRSWNWIHNLFYNKSIFYDGNYHDEGDPYCFTKAGKRFSVYQQCISIVTKLSKPQTPEEENSLQNALEKRITDRKIFSEILQAINERNEYIEYFNEHNIRTDKEQTVLDILEKHGRGPNTVSPEIVLMLACEPFVDLVKETDDTVLIVRITDLIDLDIDTIRYLLEKDSVLRAFMNPKIDEETLIELLKNHVDDFESACESGDWSIEDIVARYKEDPRHLEFMAGDPSDIILQDYEDKELLLFGLEHYEVDLENIRASLSKTERGLFDFMLNYEDEYDW